MAIDNFIPEIWSAGVQESFFANQIVIPTLNTQFAGDARRGNTVHIINATTPTITDYAAAGRVIDPEALADTEVELLIDQERAFSVNVDDVDAVQAAGSFDAWVSAAGKGLAEDAEEYVIAQLLAGATNGQESTPVAVDTYAEAKAALQKIRLLMAKAKVPTAGRFVAVNPAFADLLVSGLSDVALAGGSNELRNGQVARLFGMDVIETPAFAEAAKPVAVGYHEIAAAFVSQIDKVESLRNPNKFADIVRGLNVYGAKVTRPTAVVKYVSA
jgi:hypothetical protein